MMRGTLSMLVLAAMVAVGLWYFLARPDTPATDIGGTPPAGAARTTVSDPAPPAATARTTEADAAPSAGAAQTTQADAAPPASAARTTVSDSPTPAAIARTTADPGAVPSVPASAAETEAKQYAETPTATTPQTIPVDRAEHFVTREHVISPVPEDTIERVSVGAPAENDTLEAEAPITVVREVEQMETAVPERLIAESGGDLDTKQRVPVTYDDAEDGAGESVGETADPGAVPSAHASATETEAKQYVETLTATTPQTIPVDRAEHFVTREHVISLVPEDTIERVSVGALAEDDTLEAETSVTVVREVEQIEAAVPERLIAESGGDLDTELRVLVTYDDAEDGVGESAGEQETVERVTVREALERLRSEPGKPISIIRTARYLEVMTLGELLDAEEDVDAFLNVIRRPYRIDAATLADLLQQRTADSPDTIYYLHTVQPTDEQGIWGIVHFGLIDNFARGMAIRRGETVETYTVRIPRDADERLQDRSSSFLGKLIDRKTQESLVYNYRENRMDHNPDRIYPGQEIVIVNFEPEELVSIYRYFAGG